MSHIRGRFHKKAGELVTEADMREFE